MNSTIENLKKSVQFLNKKYPDMVPQVVVTLGSGLGEFAQRVQNAKTIPYADIPHFLSPSVEGHQGQLILGQLGKTKVAILQGRVHSYEGHSMDQVTWATRTLGMWGAKNLIVTNASGGINSNYRPGDLVLIKDHINLAGQNPLIGKNIDELGPRFPDMGKAYDPAFIEHFQKTALNIGRTMPTGVYCWLSGPSYETPAEIKMLKILGADMVGMSTVPEVIVARHMGMRVCGISCVTNLAAGLGDHPLNHEEVKEEAFKVRKDFSELLYQALSHLPLA